MENNYVGSTNNFNTNFSSPRNVVQGQNQGQVQGQSQGQQGQNDSVNRGGQKSDEKAKLPFMRKNNTAEEAEGIATTSPIRKAKTEGGKDIKTKTMKFHE